MAYRLSCNSTLATGPDVLTGSRTEGQVAAREVLVMWKRTQRLAGLLAAQGQLESRVNGFVCDKISLP